MLLVFLVQVICQQSNPHRESRGFGDQIQEVMSLQGSLSIERMCELVRVSRASFYRSFQEQHPVEEEMEVRSTIQKIAVEHRRRYGYRRITAEMRRQGMQVNHKRVLRIMRKESLLAVRRRRFLVTTNSNHSFEVYLNLAHRMRLTGINQLWVADITYIRLKANSGSLSSLDWQRPGPSSSRRFACQ